MVALAPHLVRPLPLVVSAFDGAHPDRLIGGRLEPLRRDVGRPRPPAPPAGRRARGASERDRPAGGR